MINAETATTTELRSPIGRAPTYVGVALRPFDRLFAPTVAGWVRDERELRWLAPTVVGELTPAKIVAWHKPGYRPFLLFGDGEALPRGYAELNPLAGSATHLWIGHLVVAPAHRGRGVGSNLVRMLLKLAFDDPRVERVSLVVCPDNVAALRCYQACGFRVTSTEYHRFRRGERPTRMLRLEAARVGMQNDE